MLSFLDTAGGLAFVPGWYTNEVCPTRISTIIRREIFSKERARLSRNNGFDRGMEKANDESAMNRGAGIVDVLLGLEN